MDAVCNLRGVNVIPNLFVIVIVGSIVLILPNGARHSYRL